MSLIHGSRGLIYFVHEWKPRFNESALLDDPEMLAAVTRINRQIQDLAPVLNSPSLPGLVQVTSGNAEVPVAVMAKRQGGAVYVFAVAMRDGATRARFELADKDYSADVEVLGEDRAVRSQAGGFEDSFRGWDVHLYRVAAP